MHALLTDADLSLRVAADEVAAGCRFEGELHDGGTIAPVHEIVIVLTDVYLAAAAEHPIGAAWRGQLPGIGHAGRFGARRALPHGWRDWLAAFLGRNDLVGVAPARVAAALLQGEVRGTDWLAAPVHLSAGLSQVHLDHRGLLRLAPQELALLAAAFAAEFGGSGLQLTPLPSGDFLLRAEALAAVATIEPARCAGGEIAPALPRGREAAALRRTAAEIEMWLHGQGVNAARSAAGELPLNALWLWGAMGVSGALARRQHPAGRAAFGEDAYLYGLWHLQGAACQGLPAHYGEIPHGGAGAILALSVADELRKTMRTTFQEALRALDERFIDPALRQLRRGSLERLTLIANDTALQVRRYSALKLWRRARVGLGNFA